MSKTMRRFAVPSARAGRPHYYLLEVVALAALANLAASCLIAAVMAAGLGEGLLVGFGLVGAVLFGLPLPIIMVASTHVRRVTNEPRPAREDVDLSDKEMVALVGLERQFPR